MPRFIELVTQKFEPYTLGAVTVTPQSQALIVNLPFFRFVWNRPIAVLVDRAGQTERLPIVDVTRYVVWGLMGLSAIVSTMLFMAAARRSQER